MSTNLGSTLAQRAALSPALEAYVDPVSGERWSYSQLNQLANRFAGLLQAHGLERGQRVAALLNNCVEFIALFYGAAKRGVVVVPLNTRLAAAELAFIISDCGASAVVHGPEFADTVAAIRANDEHPLAVAQWLEKGDSLTDQLGQVTGEEPEVCSAGDDNLFIMYTSGTTGLPKGVVHTHASITYSASSWATTIDVRYQDRLWLPLPMFHVAALTCLVMCTLRGITIVSQPGFDPAVAWEIIRDERVNIGGAVPAILNFMRQVPGFDTLASDHLRCFVTGAAPMPTALIDIYAAKGIQVIQGYALTETGGGGTFLLSEHALSKAGSAGKPAMFAEVALRNPEGGITHRGEGEVIIRAPFLLKEYWNRPEATEEAFDRGWFRTGDVAEIDEEGFVYIKDRIKDMIISGGENIYPAEVENAIARHEAVAEAAVIGLPDEKWGEVVCAIVVCSKADVTEDEIIAVCEQRLSRYKLPRRVIFAEAIPRNPSGKILKRVLRDQYQA